MMNDMTMAGAALETVGGAVTAALGILALVGSLLGLWRKWRETRSLAAALEESETVALGMIATLEGWKQTRPPGSTGEAHAANLIRCIRDTMPLLGAGGTLRKRVKEIEGLVGISRGAEIGEHERQLRAVRAVRIARARRKESVGKSGKSGTDTAAGTAALVMGWLFVGLAAAWLSGCACLAADDGGRLTRETVVRDGEGVEIVVEWPPGAPTDPEAYATMEIGGRMQTVAPILAATDRGE